MRFLCGRTRPVCGEVKRLSLRIKPPPACAGKKTWFANSTASLCIKTWRVHPLESTNILRMISISCKSRLILDASGVVVVVFGRLAPASAPKTNGEEKPLPRTSELEATSNKEKKSSGCRKMEDGNN
ncbi:uncharacterized protein V6R79_011086 [Siganus canaliculatus]